jgi:xanthine dehydrogenase accessory factor
VNKNSSSIIIRGGGDLATGVALRLHRVGIRVIITERSQPLAVRRLVSFAEAVYREQVTVENVTAHHTQSVEHAWEILAADQIPVFTDPEFQLIHKLDSRYANIVAIIDARMTKKPPEYPMEVEPMVIGLGPGFIAGENCHAAIETNRGHFLGRVIWRGATQADTGIPGAVANHQNDRVLRAPAEGVFQTHIEIGSYVEQDQILGEVVGIPLIAPFRGILRGLIHSGVAVQKGMKIGDLDPREDPRFANWVSEKSLAIGGGVLEALLSRPEIRARLWN